MNLTRQTKQFSVFKLLNAPFSYNLLFQRPGLLSHLTAFRTWSPVKWLPWLSAAHPEIFARNLYFLKTDKQPDQSVDHAQQVTPQDTDASDENEFLRCSDCQYPITRKRDRIEVNAKHNHVFVNPHGYVYQIGCYALAPGCVTVGEETSHFSWFPGYAWQIAICGQCLTLLGWAFRSHETRFFGLIVGKLK